MAREWRNGTTVDGEGANGVKYVSQDLRQCTRYFLSVSVHHITRGNLPSRLDTIDLRCELASGLPRALEFEGKWHTSGGQVDRIGIDRVVALGGGKAQNERGKQESKRQHVDLVALFNHRVELLMRRADGISDEYDEEKRDVDDDDEDDDDAL